MNTGNDEPTIEHGATVYDGNEVALTAATRRPPGLRRQRPEADARRHRAEAGRFAERTR